MPIFEERLKEHAQHLGFEQVGIATAVAADGFDRLREWLDRGYAGTMNYMHRHLEARRHPAGVLGEVRSVVMVGHPYLNSSPENPPNDSPRPAKGRIARYAASMDYHTVLRDKLNRLLHWVQIEHPSCRGRGVVDTAPLLERDFARRAGLGWIGKNTMLINKHRGSYLLLGALLLDLELAHDAPHVASHCGTCTACLDECPTDAFVGPGWLDSRRCISYLTIEHRGAYAATLRPGVGSWLFGCDVCQEVCPWNRRATSEPQKVDAVEVLRMSEDEFQQRFRGTALYRSKRAGLARNAAIVLGNSADPMALGALRVALSDSDEAVRDAAAWAIARIESSSESTVKHDG